MISGSGLIDTITNIPCAVSGFCIRNDEVVAFRGPFGVMGLSFYNSEGIFCLASEPQAFGEFDPFYWQKLMNGDPYGVGFRDLLPGEVIGLKDDKIVNSAIINPESLYWAGGSGVAVKQFSVGSDSLDGLIEQMSWIDDQGLIHDGSSNEFRCIFEDIYKKDPPASNHLVSTIRFRARLGRYLSPLPEGISLDDIVVMPVPDSGRSAASGYSNEYQYKMKEGFIKRVKKRSYLVSDARRSELADDKYAVVPGAFNNGKDGKVVVIIDDSIVRGTTIYRMIIKAFEAGARKVFFKSTAPPLRHFCPFSGGMDKKSDFVAMDRTLDEIYSWVFEQCLIELNDKHEQGIYSDEKFDYMLSKINKEFINIEYNTPESLINCYNSFFVDERQRICTGCINGEFPFVIQ